MVADPRFSQPVEPSKDDAAASDESPDFRIAENVDLPFPLVDVGAGVAQLRVWPAGMTHQLAGAFRKLIEDLLEHVVRDAVGVERVVETVRRPDSRVPKLFPGFVAGRPDGKPALSCDRGEDR